MYYKLTEILAILALKGMTRMFCGRTFNIPERGWGRGGEGNSKRNGCRVSQTILHNTLLIMIRNVWSIFFIYLFICMVLSATDFIPPPPPPMLHWRETITKKCKVTFRVTLKSVGKTIAKCNALMVSYSIIWCIKFTKCFKSMELRML